MPPSEEGEWSRRRWPPTESPRPYAIDSVCLRMEPALATFFFFFNLCMDLTRHPLAGAPFCSKLARRAHPLGIPSAGWPLWIFHAAQLSDSVAQPPNNGELISGSRGVVEHTEAVPATTLGSQTLFSLLQIPWKAQVFSRGQEMAVAPEGGSRARWRPCPRIWSGSTLEGLSP